MRVKILVLLGVAVTALLLTPAVMAEQNVPGSVLVFPYVNTSKTVISISNTYLDVWEGPQAGMLPNGNENCVDGDPQSDVAGRTDVYLVFYPQADCTAFDFSPLPLTPQDHASFLGEDVGFPANTVGFLVAVVVKPNAASTDIPWSFDFLVGQAWNVDSGNDFAWSYNAYPYLSVNWQDIPDDATPCLRTEYNSDDLLDFDGSTEYEQWGDELLLPRLFEEADDGANKDSLLALISPLSTIPSNRDYEVTFSTLFWNNDENGHGSPFSRTTDFFCMFTGSLREVSRQFENLGGTADAPELDTGWAVFDGFDLTDLDGDQVNNDPPLLGVFAQWNTPSDSRFTGGSNFFTRGFNTVDAQIQFRNFE